jgi:transposase-like protein
LASDLARGALRGLSEYVQALGNAPGNSPKSGKTEARMWEDFMGKQRKQRSADEKTAIVLATFRDETSVAEVARQYGVDESLVHKWREKFLESGKRGFKNGSGSSPDKAIYKENDQLKKVLGEKVLEVEILKKLGSL